MATKADWDRLYVTALSMVDNLIVGLRENRTAADARDANINVDAVEELLGDYADYMKLPPELRDDATYRVAAAWAIKTRKAEIQQHEALRAQLLGRTKLAEVMRDPMLNELRRQADEGSQEALAVLLDAVTVRGLSADERRQLHAEVLLTRAGLMLLQDGLAFIGALQDLRRKVERVSESARGRLPKFAAERVCLTLAKHSDAEIRHAAAYGSIAPWLNIDAWFADAPIPNEDGRRDGSMLQFWTNLSVVLQLAPTGVLGSTRVEVKEGAMGLFEGATYDRQMIRIHGSNPFTRRKLVAMPSGEGGKL